MLKTNDCTAQLVTLLASMCDVKKLKIRKNENSTHQIARGVSYSPSPRHAVRLRAPMVM